MNTYLLFPDMMEGLCRMNGWDENVIVKLQQALAGFDKNGAESGLLGDETTTRALDDLRFMRDLYPRNWIYRGNAVGTSDKVARATLERFEAGVDGVLFHGTEPQHLATLMQASPAHRPAPCRTIFAPILISLSTPIPRAWSSARRSLTVLQGWQRRTVKKSLR